MKYRRYDSKRNHIQKQKNIFSIFLCSFLLVIALSLTCFTSYSRAQDSAEVPVYKYYTSIEVQYGDTLWEIASRYYDDTYEDYHHYIDEVMQINRMADSDIAPGTILIVPYHSSDFIE